MKRWRAMAVVAAGYLALGGGGVSEARAGDDGKPRQPDAPKHYVEIPLGRHASSSPPAASSAAPSSSPEVDALIRQLGDADFRKREAATDKLRAMGHSVLPALRHARDTIGDPEVASRAEATIHNIEQPPAPPTRFNRRWASRPQFGGAGAGDFVFPPMGGNLNLQMRLENGGRRRIEVREAGGRVVRIDEGPDGIQIGVTTQENGQPVTRQLNARTPEQLKAKDPAMFEVYNRWSGRARGEVRGQIRIPQQRLVQPLPVAPGAADILEQQMRELRRRQMRDLRQRGAGEAEAPADELNLRVRHDGGAADVRGLLERMRAMQDGNDGIVAGELPDEEAFVARADELRLQADELILELQNLERQAMQGIGEADAAAAAVRPGPERLGVAVYDAPAGRDGKDAGVVIGVVLPDSRAERLGLKPLDVIRSVNGQPVKAAHQLRPMLAAAAAANERLVIEGTRRGEPLKITEAKPAGPK